MLDIALLLIAALKGGLFFAFVHPKCPAGCSGGFT
jgi:hypothetical protein